MSDSEKPEGETMIGTSEYQDYASEAARLTTAAREAVAAVDAATAKRSLSRTDLRAAIVALTNAAAMHQRCGVANPAEGADHRAADLALGDEMRRLRRVLPNRA